MPTAPLSLNLGGLDALRHAVAQGSGPFAGCLNKLGRLMAACWLRHYRDASRGGGDPNWMPLAESTVRAKLRKPPRGRKTGRTLFRLPRESGGAMALGSASWGAERWDTMTGTTAILIDTGMLEGALKPGAEGSRLEVAGNTCIVGFGSEAHPGGAFTYADLARIHHDGDPAHNLPARPILIHPDPDTIRQMQAAAAVAVRKFFTHRP